MVVPEPDAAGSCLTSGLAWGRLTCGAAPKKLTCSPPGRVGDSPFKTLGAQPTAISAAAPPIAPSTSLLRTRLMAAPLGTFALPPVWRGGTPHYTPASPGCLDRRRGRARRP